MKTDRIPDIYLEQYILGELPENLHREMDDLILKNPGLKDRINGILESDRDILTEYPAETMAQKILERKNSGNYSHLNSAAMDKKQKKEGKIFTAALSYVKNFPEQLSLSHIRRYVLTFSSVAALILIIVFMFPGIRSGFDTKTDIETDVRIKGLDSKLILYRIKGRNVEELKNSDAARKGDIIQAGYIATGDYKYGLILSIDGRGTVTLHFPVTGSSEQKLSMNKKILLNRSYELDDSPHFERFIMVLSSKPLNGAEIMEKAKKLAIDRDRAINGSVKNEHDEAEFSIIINKIK